jgi:hypothetical protein
MKIRPVVSAAVTGALLCVCLSGGVVSAQEEGAKPAAGAAKPGVTDTTLSKEITELEGMRVEVQKAKAGDEKSRKTADFLTRVKELADGYVAGMKYEEAGKVLNVAQAIAGQGKTGQAEEIQKMTKEVQKKKGAATKVQQLTGKFDKAKPDAKAAKQIVDLYVFELEMPEKALEYADATGDKTLGAKVKLAATPVDTLDGMQLVELGDFYALGAKNNPALKAQLHERAKETYDRALAKGIKDEKVKKRVEAAAVGEKEKDKAPTTPVGDINKQIAGIYQSMKDVPAEGAFTADQKKVIDPIVKRQFPDGKATTVGGVVTAVSAVDAKGSKDKVVVTVTIALEDFTDRKVTATVTATMPKADENAITVNGQILMGGRVVTVVLNNASNTIKMDGGNVLAYKADPNAAAAAAEAGKTTAPAKKK